MPRKLTAFILLCLVVVVTATSQAGLRYCLCLKSVFVGGCECIELARTGSPTVASDASPDGDGSCACPSDCGAGGESDKISTCDNCIVELALVLDDYTVGAQGENVGKIEVSDGNSYSLPCRNGVVAPILRSSANGTRGSPPPALAFASVPLYVRHSVYLV